MIYPDWKIAHWAQAGGVTPYDLTMIRPASIDLRWSGKAKWQEPSGGWTLFETDKPQALFHNYTYLLDTLEYIRMPLTACGFVTLKSSTGRQGVFQTHTGLVDPGFEGTLTITLKIAEDVVFIPRQPLFQMWLQPLEAPPHNTYSGRYQGQSEPQEAR